MRWSCQIVSPRASHASRRFMGGSRDLPILSCARQILDVILMQYHLGTGCVEAWE